MTQTPRDWKEDMEMCRNSHMEHYGLADVKDSLIHWLQEAKTLQEIASGRGREYLKVHESLKAAEAREQNVIKEIRRRADEAKRFGYTGTATLLLELLASLYPDTPAPKEGTPDASLD